MHATPSNNAQGKAKKAKQVQKCMKTLQVVSAFSALEKTCYTNAWIGTSTSHGKCGRNPECCLLLNTLRCGNFWFDCTRKGWKWEWTRRKWGRKTTVDLYRASSLKSKFVKLFGTESMGSLEFHQRGKIPIPEKCRDWGCWWSKSSCCVVLQHHVVLANSFAA